MQKIIYINSDNNGDNKHTKNINEYLERGWKVVKISCANEFCEGGIGGFVVLEKEEDDELVN